MKWIVGLGVLIAAGVFLHKASAGLTAVDPPRFESDWYNLSIGA